MENYPLVSILSTFKDEKNMLEIVMKSVLMQDYPNIEHIITDANSSDGSSDVYDEYSKKYSEKNIKSIWKSEPDRCIADGANKAAYMMSGEYFLFLTNPFVSANSLSTLLNSLVESNHDAVCGGVIFQREGMAVRRWRGNKWHWRFGWMAANETLCIRTGLFKKYGPFNEKYRSSFDYDFQVQLFKDKEVNIKVLKTPIIIFYAGGTSNAGISGNMNAIKEDYSILKAHKIKFAWFTILCKCIAAFFAYLFAPRKPVEKWVH
ncbi:MAG: glycosyltransferase [Oscillospiraceae bacterium]|nr:glycosyltransferase [Oscillospiraceae bacterium]